MSPEVTKNGYQEYCADARNDKQSRKDDCSPEEESLEAVQLPTSDRHMLNLRIRSQHTGAKNPRP